MPRIYLSARGEVVDFDVHLIKQQLATAPMTVDVEKRKTFIESKEVRKKPDVALTADSTAAEATALPVEQNKGLPKLEAQLAAYKAMPKPSLGEEGAKADRKHKAVTTNESAGKFKTFVLEAPKFKKALSPLEQLQALPQPIGINGGAYTYWVDVTKSPLKFIASDGAVVDEAKTLEDIKKWMDKWAADLWQEFLDGDEALEQLRDERIVRIKKPNGRMDQEDHESQM